MNALQHTLFIIALLTLVTQTVRHIYVRWFEPTDSVLDEYEPRIREDIQKAESLDELAKRYDEVTKMELATGRNTHHPTASYNPGADSTMIKQAIQHWEATAKTILELRFFWCCGAALLLLGLLCCKMVTPWLGITLMIAAFSEMIWWTSPSFSGFGAVKEVDKLLTNKIAFSLMSITLLLVSGYLVNEITNYR